MRILQLANLYAPVIGGLERSVATSSEELVRRGHEVTVLTLAAAEAGAATEAAATTEARVAAQATAEARATAWARVTAGARAGEIRNGVRVVRARSVANTLLPRLNQDPAKPFHPTAPDPLTTADIRRELCGGDYDLVHSHDWLMYSYLPLRYGKEGRPHVHTAHDFGLACVKKTYARDGGGCLPGPRLSRCVSCATGQYGRPRAAALTAALRVQRHRGIDALTAISPSVAEALDRARLPEGLPVRVVSSLVPDGLDELARNTPRPKWLPDRPYLLFVGALGPHKGVDVLFTAYRRLVGSLNDAPDLVCVGTPRADTPPIPPGVHVRHDVPHAEVMAAWHGAAAGVVPSIMEAMGQVAVEALLARTPLIVSRTGGLADMIRDGESGLHVPPGDAEALHAALSRLLTEPALADRLRSAGYRRGLDFTAARVVPQIEEIYRACIA